MSDFDLAISASAAAIGSSGWMAIVTDRVPSNEARVMRDACRRLDGHGARQTAFFPRRNAASKSSPDFLTPSCALTFPTEILSRRRPLRGTIPQVIRRHG